MSDMTVAVIDSNEQWCHLAPQWNDLLDASVSGSVFLTWEWLTSWAACCLGENRTLFVLVFHEKESLVGIAPFYIERKKHGLFTLREIRFLGSPEAGSDYLDVFTRRGREREVADTLYDFLMNEGKHSWDLMHLQDIPSEALFLLHFMKKINTEGKFAEIDYCAYCPVANLRGAEDGFPSDISLRRKKRFKQESGILYRDTGVEHTIKKTISSGCFDDFFRLYEGKAGRSGKKLRPILQGFSDRCNGSFPIQIDMLSIKRQAVAALLHLQYKNTLAIYLMAVDKEFNAKISIGNILVGKCIKNSIEAGFDAYDFLKGDESYKFHWANGGRSTMQLIFWQKTPQAVSSALTRLVKHAGKLIVR